ncbi:MULTISPECIES: polyamine ABC transporter ATP-binding protein [Shewanella]|uniref:Spermidine/putrescine import ATP-binding protein PotA n=1 Tax=Shewanella marisflavi TaxID=260364 RepID=A0AAC9U128_9GAMM|nr:MULTISPECIES: polyamine ABC transporter ATP-binding protein [Shewanella]ASJ97691.1 polyamine ABC transporter ATP-binding protein [Shewanella marisflavi]MCL1040511.1 polyamine ABC transporter ATP-binding protein [Shewanella marisflavi]QDF76253.1 polyamine ABC transporter ATP-binding protein [Shewanella marisflavi]
MASNSGVTNKPTTKTQGEVLLKIERVSKLFDDVRAVDDVSLNINRGEIFALLGGSGSGKSTLLRMLAGFEKPTEGRIYLDGQDITDMPPYERPINMMFQSYALFPHMTVAQNIAFGLKQDKMPKEEIEQRVNEMLKLVHMEAYAKRKPNQLSGGQRQRVALARSLAKRPKLLLLDEPMGALDKKLRTQMQLEVVDILEAVGVTCVMVTHDQEEAMTMAERIAIMSDGWIVQTGSPMDIYESPANRMVAEFIGSVNLFEGDIVEDEVDHVVIKAPNLPQPFYVGYGVSTSVDTTKVWVAIRPEKTHISREQPQESYNWCAGEVEDIAYLGGISVYYIRLSNGQLIQSVMTNSDRRADSPTWEEHVFVSWEATSAVVLRS